MKPTFDQYNDFLAHRSIPGVMMEHNAFVEVLGGDWSGQRGSVVSVEVLGPDPVYLIELESGVDRLVAQSCLRRVP
jgi:hypothetical protein